MRCAVLWQASVTVDWSSHASGQYDREVELSISPITTQPMVALPRAPLSAAAAHGSASDSATGMRPIPVDARNLVEDLEPVTPPQEVLDRFAAFWLMAHQRDFSALGMVSDDAPQNEFAKVVVNGKVVATLYNGGSAVTGPRGASVSLEGSGTLAGPDLAMWRAKRYAEALGGTIEMSPTARRQQDWRPPQDTPEPRFTRAELDAAIAAIQQRALVRSTGRQTDLSA
jgi:hypothetical protein